MINAARPWCNFVKALIEAVADRCDGNSGARNVMCASVSFFPWDQIFRFIFAIRYTNERYWYGSALLLKYEPEKSKKGLWIGYFFLSLRPLSEESLSLSLSLSTSLFPPLSPAFSFSTPRKKSSWSLYRKSLWQDALNLAKTGTVGPQGSIR